jgi:hypothetical protein
MGALPKLQIPRPPAGLAWLAAAWAVATLAIQIGGAWLGLFSFFLSVGWIVVTMALLGACVAYGLQRSGEGALLVALGVALLAFVCLATNLLQLAGIELRFLLEQPAYERVVGKVRAGQGLGEDRRLLGEVLVEVDPGPPQRVAFVWDGLVDNWSGVVWDPTGVVATAKGWGKRPGDYTASPTARVLFGGDLVACRSLGGLYYFCSFT